MPPSTLVAFAKFLNDQRYTTSMWEGGYQPDQANEVCHALTKWGTTVLGLEGEFVMVWAECRDTRFSGDSELAYVHAGSGTAYLLPNPFMEGDAEGFVAAVQRVVRSEFSALFEVQLHKRILFNAC